MESVLEECYMQFNGNEYLPSVILGVLSSTPTLELTPDAFHIGDDQFSLDQYPECRVTFLGTPPTTKEIVVFKQLGKYTILFGEDKVREHLQPGLRTPIKCKLVSAMVLKKAKVITMTEEELKALETKETQRATQQERNRPFGEHKRDTRHSHHVREPHSGRARG